MPEILLLLPCKGGSKVSFLRNRAPDHVLPEEVLRYAIFLLVELIGHGPRVSGDTPVVVEKECSDGEPDQDGGRQGSRHGSESGAEEGFEDEGSEEKGADGGFVRAREPDEAPAGYKQGGIAGGFCAPKPGEGAEGDGAAESGNATSPIGLGPIVQKAKAQGNQQTAEKSPGRGEPTEEHPEAEGAEQTHDEEHTGPGVAGEELAKRHGSADAWGVLGCVGGLMQDVVCFEVAPEGVGGIGEAAVSQGVGDQEMAEFIVHSGNGGREPGKERQAEGDGEEREDEETEPSAGGETGEGAVDLTEGVGMP